MPRIFKIASYILLLNIVFTGLLGQVPSTESTDSLFSARIMATGIDRANIDLEIARYHFLKNHDSLLHYVSLLEDYLESDYDIRIDAFVKKFKGYTADRKLDLEKSMIIIRESFLLFQELEDYKEMGWLSNNLAKNYFRLGDLASATEQNLIAIGYFEKVNHTRGIAEAYNNLGKISYQSGHFEKARYYFEKALATYNEFETEEPKYKIYNNLGLLLLEQKNIEGALTSFRLAAEGFAMINDERRLAFVYGNISLCYDDLNQRDTALNFSRKALRYSSNAQDKYGIITGNINLGYFLRIQGAYDSSLICFDNALKLAIEGKILGLEESVYKEYEDLYIDLNDYKNAYKFRSKYDSINRIIVATESQEKIEELIFNYNHKLEKRELNDLRINHEYQVKLTIFLIIVIALILIFSIIVVIGYIQNRKKKILLKEKNQLLRKYNERLKKSEKDLKELIADKNKLFSIIAHDLRNLLAVVTSFAELLSRMFDELNNSKRKEYINNIVQGSLRAMSLLENLLLWARSQMNLIVIKKIDIQVSKLINNSSDHLMSLIQQKELELTTKIDADFTLTVDSEMIQTVIRNLISNAIKFSFPESKILIRAFINKSSNCIEVIDYGTGIEHNQLKELFSSNNITTSTGTLNETGTGLGLMIAKDYTKKNGGKIEASSAIGKGSTFTLYFPISE